MAELTIIHHSLFWVPIPIIGFGVVVLSACMMGRASPES